MSTYPAAADYYKAVQFPSRSFTVPRLQAAEFVWDSLGPTLARGSSAVVFQASVEGSSQALRCYIRDDASSRDRYSALNTYLAGHELAPYVSGASWLDDAIRVNHSTWPVLTMKWINGRTLNEYVDFLVTGSNAAALTTLSARWRELVALLQRSEFGHGDLQHGNIMVDQDGQFRLVDFDGVWIPQLAGQAPPTESGHPNYQHPGAHAWGRWLDTFPALVIYLSLVALGKEPGLWLALNDSKNLLLARNDFLPPFQTEAWKQLAALGDPEVDELSRRLQWCCRPDWVSSQSLEAILDNRAAQPLPPGPRWWENRPAPAAGSQSPSSVPGAPPPAETVRVAALALPAPPPLSAPLSTAGTGPMTQLRRTMAPPGEDWWSGYGSYVPPRSAPGPYGPLAPGVSTAQGGYQPPHRQPPHPPARPASRPAARNALLQSPILGGLVLGAGMVLLIVGAAAQMEVLVIAGLVAGAAGIWRVVTQLADRA